MPALSAIQVAILVEPRPRFNQGYGQVKDSWIIISCRSSPSPRRRCAFSAAHPAASTRPTARRTAHRPVPAQPRPPQPKARSKRSPRRFGSAERTAERRPVRRQIVAVRKCRGFTQSGPGRASGSGQAVLAHIEGEAPEGRLGAKPQRAGDGAGGGDGQLGLTTERPGARRLRSAVSAVRMSTPRRIAAAVVARSRLCRFRRPRTRLP